MAKKKYILTISNRTALARNKRLREAGASVYVTGSTVTQAGTSGIDEKGVVDVQVQGSGNVVTDAKLNSDGSTIVLNRGLTVLDEATANARFLRKDQDDSTEYTITMGGANVTGDLNVGGDGTIAGGLSITGITRMTTAYVTESIGTPQYADGFDGYGWQISNIGENDWHLTLDSLTVRKSMNVYEMIISKIRAIGGQFIVSAANGFIKRVEYMGSDDEAFYDADGELFVANGEEFHVVREGEKTEDWEIELEDECTFVAHDLMRCQHYTGTNIKAYWVEIESVVNGVIHVPQSEFDDPASGGGLPEVGDEVVLCGNTVDTNRQNLILISATEDGLPRIDVHQGVHEKSFNLTNNGDGEDLGTIRARLGYLGNITDDWFASDNQPQGYGLYGENTYLRGNFVLANTGENVSTLFQVIQGNITALMTANENLNYLSNSSFSENTDKWTITDGEIVLDSTAGRNVLSLGASAVQANADYAAIPTFTKDDEGLYVPRNFTLSFWAKSSNGAQLQLDFNGEDKSGFEDYTSLGENAQGGQEVYVLTDEYKYYEIAFLWNGTGNFRIRQVVSSMAQTITAEIYDVKIVADNITYFTSLFNQTVVGISELSQRVSAMESTMAGLVLTSDFESYKSQMEDIIKGLEDDISANSLRFEDYVSIDAFAGLFAQEVDNEKGEGHLALIAAFVGKTYNKETGEYEIESNVYILADYIHLEGYVTINGNFRIDKEGNMHATSGEFDGTITSTSGKIGNFYIGQALDSDGKPYDDGASLLTTSEAHICIQSSHRQMDLFSEYIKFSDATYGVSAFIGSQVLPSTVGNTAFCVGRIEMSQPNVYYNIGLQFNITGATSSDSALSYGNHALYIEKGNLCGVRLRTRRVDTSVTLDVMDSVIFVISGGCTITLPYGNKGANVEDGQIYYIKLVTSGGVTIETSGGEPLNFNTSASSSTTSKYFNSGDLMILIYDAVNGVWRGGYTNYD